MNASIYEIAINKDTIDKMKEEVKKYNLKHSYYDLSFECPACGKKLCANIKIRPNYVNYKNIRIVMCPRYKNNITIKAL